MTPFAEEIKKQDIIDQLTWDDSVNANNIHVNVTDSTVELRGTVQNYTAKMAAERDAYHVAGVMDVKNYLEIEFPPAVALPEDSEITANVERILAWNSEINAGRVRVDTKNNVVTLSGKVESYWEKYLTGNLANATRGVIEVVNNLEVEPARKLVDMEIEKEIRKAFERTYLIDAEKISVDVRNGSVHLKGSVPNFFTKIQANNIAIYTTGVKDVVDDLTIG